MSEIGVCLRLDRHLHEHVGGGGGVDRLAEAGEQVEGDLPSGLRLARGLEGALEALDALIEVSERAIGLRPHRRGNESVRGREVGTV